MSDESKQPTNALDRLTDFLWYGSDEGRFPTTEMTPYEGLNFISRLGKEVGQSSRDANYQIGVTAIWGNSRKVAYTLSSDLIDTIAESDFKDCLDLPTDMIRMPYPKMYFLSQKDGVGYIEFHIFEDEAVEGRVLYFYRVAADESNTSEVWMVSLPLGKTIGEALEEFKAETKKDLDVTADDFMSRIDDLFSFVCKLSLFLTSTNDYIKVENNPPAHKLMYKPRRFRPRDNYGVNVVVGGRFESALKLHKQACKDAGGVGSPKAPHMRCGHFHKYRVGVGRTGIKVNWISPFLVNGDIEGKIEIGRKISL